MGALVQSLVSTFEAESLEIVLVNDCSPDDSHALCRSLWEQYPHVVTYVELSVNRGEHNAVMAGLRHATGEHVIIMDDDLQNPPSEALKLLEEARKTGADIVYSRYEKKRHSWLRNLGSRFNDLAATVLLKKPAGLYLSSFKCINRFSREAVCRYEGPFPYLDGLLLRVTRRIETKLVRHEARTESESGYTIRRLISLWLNMCVNFSVLPLRVSTICGVSAFTLGAVMAIYFAIIKYLEPDIPSGWASIITSILTFGGLQLIMLGVLGEYIGKILLSINQTPQYTVRSRMIRLAEDEQGGGS